MIDRLRIRRCCSDERDRSRRPRKNQFFLQTKLRPFRHAYLPFPFVYYQIGLFGPSRYSRAGRPWLAPPSPPVTFTPIFDTRRSEEHTSELQSLMRNSYAVFCMKKKSKKKTP